uniref:Uncharacterized protein n=1 Tax=Vombatus ursinus TaxID=29139 RepID=A0A4X2JNR1_VOMUR
MAPKKDPKKRPRKPQFEVGERVLCFRGPLLYEAECVKVSVKYRKVKYLVHYPGGNEKGAWVPESRILKYSETNLQKQRELLNTKKKEKKMAETGEGSSSSETSTPSRPQHSKRRARVYYEVERRYVKKTDIKVNIPNELKLWLVEDGELVVGQKQLFHLPAKKNIDSILDDYEQYEKSQGNLATSYAVTEVVAGIKAYFNVMLGPQLLYDFERPQYAELLAEDPDVSVSQIYGAAHLLRLFVKIGDMLSYTALDEQSVALLLNYLHDFLKYLGNHAAALFSPSDYEVASPEYLQKVA